MTAHIVEKAQDKLGKLLRVNKKDFTTKYWYSRGCCVAVKMPHCTPVASTGSNGDCSTAISTGMLVDEKYLDQTYKITETEFDEEAYKSALADRRVECANIQEEFKNEIFEYLEIQNNPKRNLLYQLAMDEVDAVISQQLADTMEKWYELLL